MCTPTYGQLCTGSLGDPVAEIDFGSGTGTGSALGTNVTAFTYNNTGELDEGEYVIASTTSGLKGNAWHVTTDHTGDTNGYMMVINSAVLADEGVFYTKTVTGLCGYTTYEFSAWLMNIMNPDFGEDEYHPNVTFRVSDPAGNLLGSYSTGDIDQTSSGTWLQYGFFFTLDNYEEVVITILNSAPSARPGNDIALDDISFKPCGPTITNSIENEASTNLTICQDDIVNYTFETELSSGYDDPRFQWQYSDDYGATWVDILGEINANYTFTDTSFLGDFLYRVSVANGDNINTTTCRIASDEFYVGIIETPQTLIGGIQQSFCTTQNPTINDIEVNAQAVWYDAPTGGNELDSSKNLVSGTTYYGAQENDNGCLSDALLEVTVTIISPTLIYNEVIAPVCDIENDDEEFVDLTQYESEITSCADCSFSYFLSESDANVATNQITTPTNFNWNANSSVVYVRLDSSDKCHQIAEIVINLEETPVIPIAEILYICESENAIRIDAGFGFDSYEWSTGESTQTITVTQENIGDYSVTVTEDHATYTCSSTLGFQVKISNAAIVSNVIIEDWTDDNNTITVTLSDLSLGDYEYSVDNITYQDSNIFSELNPGAYVVYIRDKNGCGLTQEEVYILYYPKFFTPNSDGFHDTWFIDYAYIEPEMTIQIFDRYGTLLRSLAATSSWNGTFNGKLMPSSDYWFVITRANGKSNQGHFTLKR